MKKATWIIPCTRIAILGAAYTVPPAKLWTPQTSSAIMTGGSNLSRYLTNSAHNASIPRSNSRGILSLAIGTVTCIATTFLMMYKNTKQAPGLFLSPDLVNTNTETARIAERLQKYGLIERTITPDGNCQFRALADQIMEDQDRHSEVRTKIIDWLKGNERYAVDDNNSTFLGDFLDRDQYPSWENYCKYMSGNKAWGDHLTLVAATEAFGVNLWVLSSVDVGDSPVVNGIDPYITTLSPRIAKPKKTARLAHYHELHYTSLHPNPPPTVPIITETSAEPA